MMGKLIFLCVVSIGCGLLFFVWYHELIIIRGKLPQPTTALDYQERTITVWYINNHSWYQEQHTVTTHQQGTNFELQLIKQWLSMLEHHMLLPKKVTVTSIATTKSGSDIFICFDRPLFHKQQSTYQKLLLLEALGKTLQENGIRAQRMHLLVDHAYMTDPHLLCNYGLPLGGFVTTHAF